MLAEFWTSACPVPLEPIWSIAYYQTEEKTDIKCFLTKISDYNTCLIL